MRPFPSLLAAPIWDLIFPFFPAITFLILATIVAVGVARVSGDSFFGTQRARLAVLAVALA